MSRTFIVRGSDGERRHEVPATSKASIEEMLKGLPPLDVGGEVEVFELISLGRFRKVVSTTIVKVADDGEKESTP